MSDILNFFGDAVTSSSSSSSSLLLWVPNLVLGFPLILEWEEEGKWREGIETGGGWQGLSSTKTKEISKNLNQSKITNKNYLCTCVVLLSSIEFCCPIVLCRFDWLFVFKALQIIIRCRLLWVRVWECSMDTTKWEREREREGKEVNKYLVVRYTHLCHSWIAKDNCFLHHSLGWHLT